MVRPSAWVVASLVVASLVVACAPPPPRIAGTAAADGRDFGTWTWNSPAVVGAAMPMSIECGYRVGEPASDFTLSLRLGARSGAATMEVYPDRVDISFPWSHVILKKSDCRSFTSELRRDTRGEPVSGTLEISCASTTHEDAVAVSAVGQCGRRPRAESRLNDGMQEGPGPPPF